MDPIAKRFMWEVISRLSTREGKTAVILTTHSMDEAQALCTRIGIMVGGELKCIGSPQHLKTRFGNHLELEIKATEVRLMDVDNLCSKIQEAFFYFPCQARSIHSDLEDLEVCIRGSNTSSAENVSEINLTREMIMSVACWLGNEDSIQYLLPSMSCSSNVFGGQISDQLFRDGDIPLRIFSEWWLTREKFSEINRFIMTSFPGAVFHGCGGQSIKYQLSYGEGSSLADIFGLIEENRSAIGIEEYSVSQSTLETIFNHFAASQHVPT